MNNERLDYLFAFIDGKVTNVLKGSKIYNIETPVLIFEVMFLFYFIVDYQFQAKKKVSSMFFADYRRRIEKQVLNRLEEHISKEAIDSIISCRSRTYIKIFRESGKWGNALIGIKTHLCTALAFEIGSDNVYLEEYFIFEDIVKLNVNNYVYQNISNVYDNYIKKSITEIVDWLESFDEQKYHEALISFSSPEKEREHYASGLKYCKKCQSFVKPDFHDLCPICDEPIK